MDKLTPKETSKGAEEIVLTQIKQDFITPANAIFDYVDMVEKALNEADLESEDEIEQIKSSCSKLIDQYEVAFVQNTGVNADSSKKSPEEYSELRHNLRTPLNAIIGYSEILMEDYEDDLDEGTLEDFQQIINLAKKNGIQVVLIKQAVYFDPKIQKNIQKKTIDELISTLQNLRQNPFQSLDYAESFWIATISILNKQLDKFKNHENVLIVDPINALISKKNNFEDYSHLTPEGNAVIADSIFQAIKNNL